MPVFDTRPRSKLKLLVGRKSLHRLGNETLQAKDSRITVRKDWAVFQLLGAISGDSYLFRLIHRVVEGTMHLPV